MVETSKYINVLDKLEELGYNDFSTSIIILPDNFIESNSKQELNYTF